MASWTRQARNRLQLAGLAFSACVCVSAVGAEIPGAPPSPSVAVAAPAGWGCNDGSMVMVGDEVLPVLMCLPDEGGSPISFRRLARSESPASLQAFLSSETARAAAAKKENVLVTPRRVSLGGREAVESAFQNHGIAHGTDGTPSEIDMIAHTFTFRMDGVFFQCQLDASPGLYNDELRKALLQFCSSARSAPAPASPGHS